MPPLESMLVNISRVSFNLLLVSTLSASSPISSSSFLAVSVPVILNAIVLIPAATLSGSWTTLLPATVNAIASSKSFLAVFKAEDDFCNDWANSSVEIE